MLFCGSPVVVVELSHVVSAVVVVVVDDDDDDDDDVIDAVNVERRR